MAATAGSVPAPAAPARGLLQRVRVALAGLFAGILGVAPHVLHHVGPLAGAALFAGFGGTLLFGAIGFALAIPTLLKLRRRTGGWRVPAAAFALMATAFSISAFVIGPAIAGGDESQSKSNAPAQSAPGAGQGAPAQKSGHEAHHQ